MITKLKNPLNIGQAKMSFSGLLILACISFVIVFINLQNVTRNPLPDRGEMISAARQMVKAIQEIRKFRSERHIPIPVDLDPIESGMIGREFSAITTTLGDLKAKQVSVNPDFSALLVHWFHALDLSAGDRVVIHASGSFPSLSIASIIAAETVGLNPLIFSSIGSSSFGANIPELTYWDMEHHLYRMGIIRNRTQYATPGGENDNGSSFWSGGVEIAKTAALRNNYPFVLPDDLRQAIEMKYQWIKSWGNVKLFINIGGNQAALGRGTCTRQIPAGLITDKLSIACDTPGLIHLLNCESIPIIHLLNIKELTLQNGIALDPVIKDNPGYTRLYYKIKRPVWMAMLSLIILTLLMGGVRLYEKKYCD